MPTLTIKLNDYFKVTGHLEVTPRGVKQYLRKTVIGGTPKSITRLVTTPQEITVEYSGRRPQT